MAAVPTTNNGSTFYNQNDCRTFKQTITTSLVRLSSYPCSEVIITNRTGGNVNIFDNDYNSTQNAMLLLNNDTYTFRGITNTSVVSASAAATGDIYYRTQYFSILTQR
jgi:hypothetical protein